MEKQQLRKELKSLRNKLSMAQVTDWSKKICENIINTPQYRQANVILGYLAFGNEPNIDSVLQQALLNGKTVCIPQIVSKTKLRAVKFNGFNELELDQYGIRSLRCNAEVIETAKMDLLLIPGVGFAKNGSRIGMGAGYYDRFLTQAKSSALMGVTYDALLCNMISMDIHDIPVQYLVTETIAASCEQLVYKSFDELIKGGK